MYNQYLEVLQVFVALHFEFKHLNIWTIPKYHHPFMYDLSTFTHAQYFSTSLPPRGFSSFFDYHRQSFRLNPFEEFSGFLYIRYS